MASGQIQTKFCLFEIEIKLEVLTERHSSRASDHSSFWASLACGEAAGPASGAVTCGSRCDPRLLSQCSAPEAGGKNDPYSDDWGTGGAQPLESVGFLDSKLRSCSKWQGASVW